MLEEMLVPMAYLVCTQHPVLCHRFNICLRESSMVNLCCMSFLGKDSSEILVAGCQNTMYRIDVEKGIVLQEVDL